MALAGHVARNNVEKAFVERISRGRSGYLEAEEEGVLGRQLCIQGEVDYRTFSVYHFKAGLSGQRTDN